MNWIRLIRDDYNSRDLFHVGNFVSNVHSSSTSPNYFLFRKDFNSPIRMMNWIIFIKRNTKFLVFRKNGWRITNVSFFGLISKLHSNTALLAIATEIFEKNTPLKSSPRNKFNFSRWYEIQFVFWGNIYSLFSFVGIY